MIAFGCYLLGVVTGFLLGLAASAIVGGAGRGTG